MGVPVVVGGIVVIEVEQVEMFSESCTIGHFLLSFVGQSYLCLDRLVQMSLKYDIADTKYFIFCSSYFSIFIRICAYCRYRCY